MNDTYPSDCIKFRSVLSPSQARFRVDGVPLAVETEKPAVAAVEPSSADSLPLKPPKKERERQHSTESSQSHMEESAPAGRAVSGVVVKETAPEPAPHRELDALDEMIEEALAVQHLVSDSPFQSM